MRRTHPLQKLAAAMLKLSSEGDGRFWGFELMQATGLASGTVYPMLARLEGEGMMHSGWGEQADDDPRPRRRYYELTKTGHDFLGGIQ